MLLLKIHTLKSGTLSKLIQNIRIIRLLYFTLESPAEDPQPSLPGLRMSNL